MVERLEKRIDGPTCNVYLAFRLKSTPVEYMHSFIKILVKQKAERSQNQADQP
jgi:hypothetical protein